EASAQGGPRRAHDSGGLARGAGIEGPMKIEVVTLFPRMIAVALEFGIVGRAIGRGLLSVGTEDPRAHATDAHRTVDDRPYGGGPGMVMKPEPLLAAIRAAHARLPAGSPRVYLSAQGRPFRQAQAQELAALPGVLLLAGRYEGVDERVIELGIDLELSVARTAERRPDLLAQARPTGAARRALDEFQTGASSDAGAGAASAAGREDRGD